MKKSLINALGAMMLALATAGTASASITPVYNAGAGTGTWFYAVAGDTNEALITGSYFTIYDIPFLMGASGPTIGPYANEWSATIQASGITPAALLPLPFTDSTILENVTFTYNGPTVSIVPAFNCFLECFEVDLTPGNGPAATQGWYSYQAGASGTGTGPFPNALTDQGSGNVLIPLAPEPASMALVAGGLALMGLVRSASSNETRATAALK